MFYNKERDDTRLAGAVNATLENSNSEGLSAENKDLLAKLIKIRQKRLNNNTTRWDYYKDKTKCKKLGVEIPREYEKMNLAVGWSAKAVDLLAQRSSIDGFTFNGEANDFIDNTMRINNLKTAYKMALPSELVYGVGFWTVTDGDDDIPVIRYFNATRAAAIWDYDKRNISCGFVITDFDTDQNNIVKPSVIELYTATDSIQITYKNNGWKITKSVPNIYGQPMMVAMSFRPDDDRPFGKSRVSKTVMAIIDQMQQETLRMAMHADVFSVPHRYLLGASEEMFDLDKRKAYFQNMLIAERDENGDLPQYGQLSAASMQPHVDVMRNLASRFAAETSIPVHLLGIVQDNPASAEALYATSEELCKEAEDLNESNGYTISNIARMVFMVSQKKSYDELTDDEMYITVNWKNPYTPSIASQTDAMVKQASVCPWLVEYEEYWRQCGYNDEIAKKYALQARRYRIEQRVSQLTYQPTTIVEQPNNEEVIENGENQPAGNGEPAQ